MKLPDIEIRVWWRAAIMASGIIFMTLTLFSFLLYQRVSNITNQSVSLPAEDNAVSFSPALLDDMKAFWEERNEADQFIIKPIR